METVTMAIGERSFGISKIGALLWCVFLSVWLISH